MFMARVSEQSLKYKDMYDYVKEVIEHKTTDYTVEERNMLSVSFKNVVSADRKAVKLIEDIAQFEKF